MGERISKKTAKDVMEILSSEKEIEILGDGRYRVPSQTTEEKMYMTVVGDEAEYCDCPHSRKGTVTCKHIRAVQILHMLSRIATEIVGAGDAKAAAARPKRGMEIPESRPTRCTECLSTEFRKWGLRGTGRKDKVQTYKCYKCNTRFSADPETHRLALSPKDVARVVGTYLDGLSYKETADHMRREGIDISPSTVGNYVSLVVDACMEYVMTLLPDISDTWSIDGLEVTIRKSLKRYFYCIMDHRSHLMLALREFRTKGSSGLKDLFRDAKKMSGGDIPKVLLSDAEPAIAKASRETLRKTQDGATSSTFHNAGAHVRGERTNNRQERLERILARWARRYGFVSETNSGRTRGMLIQYNFCRTHNTLGQTPAAAAGLVLHGDDPWLTLYTNAAWNRIERGIRAARKSRKPRGKKSAEKCDKITRWLTGRAADCVS